MTARPRGPVQTTDPLQPLTAEHVASWFPASGRFHPPEPAACTELTRALQLAWLVTRNPGATEGIEHGNEHLAHAATACRTARDELQHARRLGGDHYDGKRINDLLNAIEQFLAIGPDRAPGRPTERWHEIAQRLAPLVENALRPMSPKQPAASARSSSGPVAQFLVRAMAECYGIRISAETIGRRLRQSTTGSAPPSTRRKRSGFPPM